MVGYWGNIPSENAILRDCYCRVFCCEMVTLITLCLPEKIEYVTKVDILVGRII